MTPVRTSTSMITALAAVAVGAGCWGSIGDPGASGGECGLPPVPPARRLSHTEYRNTVRDLFPGLSLPDFQLAPDPTPTGFDNDAEALQPSALLVNQYNAAAVEIAARVGRRMDTYVPCPASEGSACGARFIADLATRAYRRPLAPAELATLQQVFDTYLAQSDFGVAVELTTQVILQSPAFLYRVESIGPDGEPSPYDVASRLSYLLWATMPDETLFAAAAQNQLATAAELDAQVERMHADPRALDGFMTFASQWLDLARIDRVTKLSGSGFSEPVRQALREEARRFLAEVIYARGGSVTDLLTSPKAFITAETAAFYGLNPPPAGSWAEVDLPPERKGFLMQAQFLASHGHPNNPSPVLRGLFVLSDLLCVELGSPPAGVDMSIPTGDPQMGPTTNRQNYDRVTGAELCQTCHSIINPIGYAFEGFDTMGRVRDSDNGLPLDTTGVVAGRAVANASALVDFLAGSEQVRECVTRKYMLYATAGSDAIDDRCLTRDIAADFTASGGSLRGLMKSIATHPRFLGTRTQAERSEASSSDSDRAGAPAPGRPIGARVADSRGEQ